jgi:hypothetical protein
MEKEFLSPRLFPKNQGADAYQMTGIPEYAPHPSFLNGVIGNPI